MSMCCLRNDSNRKMNDRNHNNERSVHRSLSNLLLVSPLLLLSLLGSPLPQSYMEDHMKNKDRLQKEWEALGAYQAEPNACTVGLRDGNAKKNRSAAVVACEQ